MNKRTLKRLQRQSDRERELCGLPRLDLQKLLQVPAIRDAILETAKGQQKRREGGDR